MIDNASFWLGFGIAWVIAWGIAILITLLERRNNGANEDEKIIY